MCRVTTFKRKGGFYSLQWSLTSCQSVCPLPLNDDRLDPAFLVHNVLLQELKLSNESWAAEIQCFAATFKTFLKTASPASIRFPEVD